MDVCPTFGPARLRSASYGAASAPNGEPPDRILEVAQTGADEVRTRDPLLAKQVLYQLSYDPIQGLYRVII